MGEVTDKGGQQGAVLAPAVAAVGIGDDLFAVHVVGHRVADQAVDGVLSRVPGSVQGHHLAQGRLILAADVALAAAFAEGVAGLGHRQISAQAVMANEPGLGQGRFSLPMAKLSASSPLKP